MEQVPWESLRIMRCEIQIEKAHLRGISYSLKDMFKLIIVFFLQGWFMKYEIYNAAAAAKSLQSCPTLYDPIDGSPPGSPVPGILQARTLEWVAIFFSNAWKWKVKVKSLSHVWLLTTPRTAAYQAPPSMEFSRLEYRSGLPLPSLEIYNNPTQIYGTHIYPKGIQFSKWIGGPSFSQ